MRLTEEVVGSFLQHYYTVLREDPRGLFELYCDDTVCELFAEGGALSTQAAGEFVNDRSEWVKHLPWLYHRDHSRADSSQIKMKVGFTASEATNDAALGIIRTLPFKLSAYAVSPRSAGPARSLSVANSGGCLAAAGRHLAGV